MRDAGPGPLAIDRTSVPELDALTNVGCDVVYAQDIVEQARLLKSADEVQAMQASIRVAEQALAEIEQAAEPGVSESHLWAILNRVNAERDGEWIETRLLNSGPRTRPWYQEASPRVIQEGDLVCLDTDMIGPFGYNADISRTFLAGDKRRSGDQRMLYALAIEQLDHNAALLRDGLTFAEFHEQAFQPPTGYRQHSFGFVHGVGLSVEYPRVPPAYESLTLPYDGVFRADMIVCAESYIAADHGSQGVKLENPYLIHDRGSEPLTAFPFSDALAT